MKSAPLLPVWTIATPVVAWLLFGGTLFGLSGAYLFLVAAGLIGSVLSAVHHAEVVAHRVGEPFGTMVLAIAVTARARMSVPRGSPTRCATTSA